MGLYGPYTDTGNDVLARMVTALSLLIEQASALGGEPADGSVTDAKVSAGAAIAQAKIAGLVAALAALTAADTAEATTRATADALRILLTEKGAANGVATLGADSKIPSAQLPSLAIGETFTVASQAAMLALSGASRGDMAVRTDLDPDGIFWLTSDSPGTLADWLRVNLGGVVSVDGLTGAVDLSAAYVDTTTQQDITERKTWRGVSRGEGSGDYLTEIGGDWPYIATNAAVIINGAIGDPVPSVIAGEGNYMLGISSDMGDYPVVVVRAQSGPVLRFYDAGPNLVYEVIAAGMVYARPGVSDGGGNLPAYSFIANRHTGMDMTGADIIVFYSAASEKVRITSTGMTVTGDFVTTQKINTGDAGIDLNNKWLFYLPGGTTSYLRDLGNARMQVTFEGGASSATALTSFASGVAVAGALTVTGDIPSLGGVGAQQEISLTATPKAVVGAWTAQQGGYMFMQYNSSSAQNDSASFGFAVPAGGTYTIEIIAESGGDSAIADITIDGGASVGTADLYGAGAPLRRTIPGVVLTPGTHTLKLTGSTKNGSSSGYLMRLHRAMLTRTA